MGGRGEGRGVAILGRQRESVLCCVLLASLRSFLAGNAVGEVARFDLRKGGY